MPALALSLALSSCVCSPPVRRRVCHLLETLILGFGVVAVADGQRVVARVVVVAAGASLLRYLEVFDVDAGFVVGGGPLGLKPASCTTHGVSVATTAHTRPLVRAASAPGPASNSKPARCAAVASSSCAAAFAGQPTSAAGGISSFAVRNCCTTAGTLFAVAVEGVVRSIVVAAAVASVGVVVVVGTSFVGVGR